MTWPCHIAIGFSYHWAFLLAWATEDTRDRGEDKGKTRDGSFVFRNVTLTCGGVESQNKRTVPPSFGSYGFGDIKPSKGDVFIKNIRYLFEENYVKIFEEGGYYYSYLGENNFEVKRDDELILAHFDVPKLTPHCMRVLLSQFYRDQWRLFKPSECSILKLSIFR